MRNDKKKVISVLAILVTALFLASAMGCYLYSFQFSKTYAATYAEKLERLKTLEGSKAIFVGGSSCMFGVQTELFEYKTGIPSVNMAVSAGIPMKFYLDSICRYLNEGDSLFLCFEYGYYSYDWDMIGESGFNFLMYQDSSIIAEQSLMTYIRNLPELISLGWKNWENMAQEYIKNELLSGYGVYTRDCINENGDMVAHKGENGEKVADAAPVNYVDTGTKAALGEYIEKLLERGIMIYFVAQPTMESRYESSIEDINQIWMSWNEYKGVCPLGAAQDYVYEKSCFFDTPDHLNYDAAILHTNRIIEFYLSFWT